MFDVMLNPHFNAGLRPADSTDAFDTMMQFMQSMQNRSIAPNMITQQDLGTAQQGTAFGASDPEAWKGEQTFIKHTHITLQQEYLQG